MIGPCPSVAQAPLIPGLLGAVDCTAQGLAEGGYAALAAPGGPVATTITGLLTLFVGFYAYRLILGRTSFNLGEVAVIAVKIGLVGVLASNWAVYQHIVQRTLTETPQAIADLLLGRIGRGGSALSPVPLEALQQVFDELMRDVRALSGKAGDRSPLIGGAPFATMMLNASAYGMAFGSAGTLAAVRIGLALLLAIGPVVAGFLLFDATRGLVEGWLRAMIALALVSLAANVLLSIEIALIEPALVQLARERAIDAITPESAMRVAFVAAVFGLAGIGAMVSAFLVARGLRLPGQLGGQARPAEAPAAPANPVAPAAPAVNSRVAQIAVAAESVARGAQAHAASPARSIEAALPAGDRYREAAAAMGGGGAAIVHGSFHHSPRAARPRRELLVSRRKR